jgi:ferric-dicitrate binding protein FerR (iron transport regulator)
MKKLLFTGFTALAMMLATVPESRSASPAQMQWTRNVVQYARGGRWVNAYRGLPLNSGAYVRTGSDSRAQIQYADGTIMRMGSRSIARIRYVGSKNVTVSRGKAYFKVSKQRSRMKVRTRTAVATVLGTEFVVEVKDIAGCTSDCGDTTKFTTLEGNVGVSGIDGNGMIELGAGMTTEVSRGQNPQTPQSAGNGDLNPEGLSEDKEGPDGDLARQGLDPSNPQQQLLIQQNSPGVQGSLDTGAATGTLDVTIQ